VVAPKYKLTWQRKEAPSVISSSASQEHGDGMAGRRDLKMTMKRRDVVHLIPPVGEDPLALSASPFQGEGG
jgi:hypothetical protein